MSNVKNQISNKYKIIEFQNVRNFCYLELISYHCKIERRHDVFINSTQLYNHSRFTDC